MVRRLEAKFRRPATGRVSARAAIDPAAVAHVPAELQAKGRVMFAVPVEVVDETGTVALSAHIEWFIAANPALE